MWLRRTPRRTKAQGSTAFGSGSKRFDPAIKIIDWSSLEQPSVPSVTHSSGKRASNATELDLWQIAY